MEGRASEVSLADWRSRAQISGDVVYFQYSTQGVEKNVSEVFVWDLDKTYLDTSLDSLWAVLRIAIERAFQKKNIPGTQALLTVLAREWSQQNQNVFPIFFITASPPQMEERMTEKFTYDRIKPLGCFYKDNLRNLHPKRLWRLTKQVGYKVQALLQLRTRLGKDVQQVLFGDDSESDAVIYSLYSDICARRLGAADLRELLRSLWVTGEQIDEILQLQLKVPENDPVQKVYINLAEDTDPEYYLKFGRRTLPTANSFQVAVDLYQDCRLSREGVLAVAQDLVYNFGFTPDELLVSFEDLIRRKVLGARAVSDLLIFFAEKGLFPVSYKPSFHVANETRVENGRVFQLEGHFEPWVPERVDYFHDDR